MNLNTLQSSVETFLLRIYALRHSCSTFKRWDILTPHLSVDTPFIRDKREWFFGTAIWWMIPSLCLACFSCLTSQIIWSNSNLLCDWTLGIRLAETRATHLYVLSLLTQYRNLYTTRSKLSLWTTHATMSFMNRHMKRWAIAHFDTAKWETENHCSTMSST